MTRPSRTKRALPLALMLASGCKLFFPAPVPMHSVTYEDPKGGAKCLLVFMPGFGDSDDTFEKERFVSFVRSKDLSVDMIASNATLGYYLRGVVAERVETDVLSKTHGKYEKTWLLGVSMGGMGSLLYAQAHSKEVDGLLLLAPYLGDSDLLDEIRVAGGPLRWKGPAPAPLTEDNYQRQIWGWLSRVLSKQDVGPEIYIGYAKADSLERNDRVLADALPTDHVFSDDGNHDWGPWRNMFSRFLNSSIFARDCARPNSDSGH